MRKLIINLKIRKSKSSSFTKTSKFIQFAIKKVILRINNPLKHALSYKLIGNLESIKTNFKQEKVFTKNQKIIKIVIQT